MPLASTTSDGYCWPGVPPATVGIGAAVTAMASVSLAAPTRANVALIPLVTVDVVPSASTSVMLAAAAGSAIGSLKVMVMASPVVTRPFASLSAMVPISDTGADGAAARAAAVKVA